MQIKFRAWDRNRKEMAYFSLFEIPKVLRPGEIFLIGEVMQYTGLKDKTGREIAEGDIVKHSGWKNCEVEWKYNSFYPLTARYNNGNMHADDWEIIGNIHENPELLEAKS